MRPAVFSHTRTFLQRCGDQQHGSNQRGTSSRPASATGLPRSHDYGATTVTGTSLITAVTVGLVLGVLVRWLVPACRNVPFWLPLAVGVGAAVLASVTARLAGLDTSGVSAVELILQVVLAGLGVGAVAVTADKGPSASRYDQAGRRR